MVIALSLELQFIPWHRFVVFDVGNFEEEKLVRSYQQLIINTREPTAPVCCMFMKTSNHLARLKYSLSITERRETFSLYKHVMFYSRQLH